MPQLLYKFLPFSLFILISCNTYKALPVKSMNSMANQPFLNIISDELVSLRDSGIKTTDASILKNDAILIRKSFGPQKPIYNEMVELFNPDNFNCGLGEKLKAKIKESKRQGESISGYVPDIVINNLSKYKNAVKLDDRGANALVHLFTYETNDNQESKPIVSQNTPTQLNFSTLNLIDNQNENYSSFSFTMDCSGYFSASAKVTTRGGFLGFGKVSATAEGENMINKNQSILIIRSLIYSPLYASYDGSFIYQIKDEMDSSTQKAVLKNRLLTLQGILNAIPKDDQIDDKRIYLAKNYEVIITSNKGNSGYNGAGKINADVQLNYSVVQSSGATNASNSVSRKSDYTNYSTYILEKDKDAIADKITFKRIKDKINELKSTIDKL